MDTKQKKEIPKNGIEIVVIPIKSNPPFYDVCYRYIGKEALHSIENNLTYDEAIKTALDYIN